MENNKKHLPDYEISSRDMQFSYVDGKGKDFNVDSDVKFFQSLRTAKSKEGGKSENNGTDK